jgi:hypothetical protein
MRQPARRLQSWGLKVKKWDCAIESSRWDIGAIAYPCGIDSVTVAG